MDRRSFLTTAGATFGAGLGAPFAFAKTAPGTFSGGQHHPATAKRVVMIFLTGGCSHVDSFDPKPALISAPSPKEGRNYLASPWEAKRRGKSGILTTDLFPEIGHSADDLCFIRGMHGDHNNHTAATLGMHTGSVTEPKPSIGSWISYGLGSENRALPGHVVLAKEPPYSGSLAWDSNFLPAQHQGVRAVPSNEPIRHLAPHNAKNQRAMLDLLSDLNERHGATRHDTDLLARQMSFETAAAMEEAAPAVFDLKRESIETRALYGLDDKTTSTFAWQCLAARRLLESGVRFVELVDTGSNSNWDGGHGDIQSHGPLADKIDRPIAGLIKDLKRRGMFDDTLVVFCTEFGRTPYAEGKKGRNHYAHAFSCWMAGGGAKAGHVHGATDNLGEKILEGGVHTHDFHATILHMLGLDHEKLTYHHNGRDYRLTDVHGRVVSELLA